MPRGRDPVRARAARAATRGINALSRRLGRGQGTVAGGRVGLRIDSRLLEHLSARRQVVLVSGTNGKTTTTQLLAVALGAQGDEVVSNGTGSNMPPGQVAALAEAPASQAPRAVLETDEMYLPRVLAQTSPAAVVLLNLSRDQLDRSNEVRMVAGRWRAALAAAPHTQVVANADDPLVVWGASAARDVHWVGVGLRWRLDAVGCPSCDGRIEFGEGTWACTACEFARPEPEVWLETTGEGSPRVVWGSGRAFPLRLSLPGRFNLANATLALVAAEGCGIEAAAALDAMAAVAQVAGRFTVRRFGDVRARLMLAKNPAGWSELLDLVAGSGSPLVIGINARTADGTDPSWLWDVPFERLAGRAVVATGERALDLAVRLLYAGVTHVAEPDPLRAVTLAAGEWATRVAEGVGATRVAEGVGATRVAEGVGATRVAEEELIDVIGNYTAFHDFLRAPA